MFRTRSGGIWGVAGVLGTTVALTAVALGGPVRAASETEPVRESAARTAVSRLHRALTALVVRLTFPLAHTLSALTATLWVRRRWTVAATMLLIAPLGLTEPAWAAVAVATPGPPMTSPRADQVAVTLTDGRVLMIGGSSLGGSAEWFDPITKSWNPTGPMVESRGRATATLLPSGKVLVTGGYVSRGGCVTCGSYTASAELFDPATNTWRPSASMHVERGNHTATLLNNGKVLVAGGFNWNAWPCGIEATTELYDPAANTWAMAPSMRFARFDHTATLLGSGDVLVGGGDQITGTKAEIYHPATASWKQVGDMLTRPFLWAMGAEQTATLLPNGRVLVLGGQPLQWQPSANTIAQIYNPAAGTWTLTTPLPDARGAFFTATRLPDGRVFVAGGGREGVTISPTSADVFDPVTATWTQGPLMAERWLHATALLRDGSVLVAGGSTENDFEVGPLITPLPTTELVRP